LLRCSDGTAVFHRECAHEHEPHKPFVNAL
jgi:hypothetical protein